MAPDNLCNSKWELEQKKEKDLLVRTGMKEICLSAYGIWMSKE
jgi:hypothetical protein